MGVCDVAGSRKRMRAATGTRNDAAAEMTNGAGVGVEGF